MHRTIKRILFLLLPAIFFSVSLMAQETAEPRPEMADLMRSNGKIYVVVAVVLTILVGIFLYLLRLERKVGRLERE